MKYYLTAIFCLLMGLVTFTSCSEDGDPFEFPYEGSFNVNGTNCKIMDATCTYDEDGYEDLFIPPHSTYGIQFHYKEQTYRMEFQVYYASDYTKLTPNEDVAEDVRVLGFYPITYISSPRYEELSGKVIVREAKREHIVLEFKDYTFNEDDNGYEQTFKINGAVKFYDLNAD